MQDDQLPLPPGYVVCPPRKIPTPTDLSEIWEKAHLDGFLKISDLADILSSDDRYQIHLPELWDRFDLNKLRKFPGDISTPESRFGIWFDLLDRLTTGTLAAPKMDAIRYFLPAYKGSQLVQVEVSASEGFASDPDYVKPEEVIKYFKDRLEIPLPDFLFPPEPQPDTAPSDTIVKKLPPNLKRLNEQKDKAKAEKLANKYIADCKSNGKTARIYEAKELIKNNLSKTYTGKHTIHDWIKELFPEESRKERQGRPRKE